MIDVLNKIMLTFLYRILIRHCHDKSTVWKFGLNKIPEHVYLAKNYYNNQEGNDLLI